jgi:hypothetical protein
MDACQKSGYLRCSYTNGYKYKVENGRIYRKSWETDEVLMIYLSEKQVAEVDEFDIVDPYNNSRTWSFLRKIWREAREETTEEPIICKESDFE